MPDTDNKKRFLGLPPASEDVEATFRYIDTSEGDVTVHVSKVGGGTIGKSYEGEWGVIVSSHEVGAVMRDVVKTGTPKNHQEVALLAADLFPGWMEIQQKAGWKSPIPTDAFGNKFQPGAVVKVTALGYGATQPMTQGHWTVLRVNPKRSVLTPYEGWDFSTAAYRRGYKIILKHELLTVVKEA